MSHYHISGVPIIDDGKLVGILTNRDVRFATDLDAPVREFMTCERLITAPLGTSLEEAKAILHSYRIEKLPLVDEEGNLRGLITYKDILKKLDFPHAATDEPRPAAGRRGGGRRAGAGGPAGAAAGRGGGRGGGRHRARPLGRRAAGHPAHQDDRA